MAERRVTSEISGAVWKILKQPGERVAEDEPIMILESMKMEIPVVAPEAGTVQRITVEETQVITEGDVVALLET